MVNMNVNKFSFIIFYRMLVMILILNIKCVLKKHIVLWIFLEQHHVKNIEENGILVSNKEKMK